MAVKFQFIELLRSRKGQLLLAFFSWSLCHHSWGQVSAFVEADHNASSGLAISNHWLSAGLAQPGSDEWVHYRANAGLAYTRSSWSFSIAQTKQGYLYSSSNALFLAAENDNKKSIDLTTQGHFPLHAELWTLKATTFAASFNQALSDDLTVLVKPYVLKIQDYQHTQAQFKLINQGNESQIIGKLHRTGTRSTGDRGRHGNRGGPRMPHRDQRHAVARGRSRVRDCSGRSVVPAVPACPGRRRAG
jgi:phage tail protein X